MWKIAEISYLLTLLSLKQWGDVKFEKKKNYLQEEVTSDDQNLIVQNQIRLGEKLTYLRNIRLWWIVHTDCEHNGQNKHSG